LRCNIATRLLRNLAEDGHFYDITLQQCCKCIHCAIYLQYYNIIMRYICNHFAIFLCCMGHDIHKFLWIKNHGLIWYSPLRDLHILITWFHHVTYNNYDIIFSVRPRHPSAMIGCRFLKSNDNYKLLYGQ